MSSSEENLASRRFEDVLVDSRTHLSAMQTYRVTFSDFANLSHQVGDFTESSIPSRISVTKRDWRVRISPGGPIEEDAGSVSLALCLVGQDRNVKAKFTFHIPSANKSRTLVKDFKSTPADQGVGCRNFCTREEALNSLNEDGALVVYVDIQIYVNAPPKSKSTPKKRLREDISKLFQILFFRLAHLLARTMATIMPSASLLQETGDSSKQLSEKSTVTTLGRTTIAASSSTTTTCGEEEDRLKVTSHTLLDLYGDKGTYTGVILGKTGMPHGHGRMLYENGDTYEGDWHHGRWHGVGRTTFANGDSYVGQCRDDQRHGHGKHSWKDGREYEGDFYKDKRQGKGIFKWPDGSLYVGEFRRGQREGHGRFTFPRAVIDGIQDAGGYYEGSWIDGRYDGYGICKWKDGRCYEGEWKQGLFHGQGTELQADGIISHEGQWISGEPVVGHVRPLA